MCGRFTLTVGIEEIARRFAIDHYDVSWSPRYNIAPSQSIISIIDGNFQMKKWGIVSPWNKSYRLINAKGETLFEKPLFKKCSRCLIPADGFYEWVDKKPYRIVLKEAKLFAFAGIWDGDSATIVTTNANSLLSSLHNRMPVILERRLESEWLSLTDEKSLKELLTSYPSDQMEFYPVSPAVNSWKLDKPELINRL